MDKISIIIDIDNTIIDTAIRKQKILKSKFGLDVPLEKIRKDYNLVEYFGTTDAKLYKDFVKLLNTPSSIKEYPANIFTAANSVIEKLIADGNNVILLSARPRELYSETQEELKSYGINTDKINLILADQKEIKDNVDGRKFKDLEVSKILKSEKVLAFVGDRHADMIVAESHKVPGIMLNDYENISEIFKNDAGFFICNDWLEIYNTINKLKNGSEQMEALRLRMIDQYSSWLKDIDDKAKLNVTIATAILALSSTIIKEHLKFDNLLEIVKSILIFLTFIISLLSIIYSLRSITSRYTSGKNANNKILTKFKHALNILSPKFYPTHRFRDDDDPVKHYDDLKESSEEVQKNAHLTYFLKTYKTYDRDAVLNLRLFALKATNYVKAYPERISSKLLEFSIYSIALWVIAPYIFIIFSSLWKMLFHG